MKFTLIDYCTSGRSNLKYHKGDLSMEHQKKRQVKKKPKEIISRIRKDSRLQ